MKAKTFICILIVVAIVSIILAGCASRGGLREPINPDSTLLMGRILVIVKNFPNKWHVNGEYTGGITIYLIETSTMEVIELDCYNTDGFFCLNDPKDSRYVLAGFSLKKSLGNRRFTASREVRNTYFDLTKNSVNNLGTIHWIETYKGREKKIGGSTYIYRSQGLHQFLKDYDKVESWFKETNPDSAWNNKKWIGVEYKGF